MKNPVALLNIPETLAQTIWDRVTPFTMTSPERIAILVGMVQDVLNNKTPGSIVECGVWKGGCMMAVALTLLDAGDTSRDLYLFDTFAGMTRPTEKDVPTRDEINALQRYEECLQADGTNAWCGASLESVKENMASTGYPMDKIHFIKGDVEETLPLNTPEKIALLRLDTDWYESTKAELHYMYPNVIEGGCLYFDDYGFWQGARKAVDEYFTALKNPPSLHDLGMQGAFMIKRAM